MTAPLVARAGTIILNRDGSPAAQIMRDIHRGEVLQTIHFQFADGHVPVRGELLPQSVSDFLCGAGIV